MDTLFNNYNRDNFEYEDDDDLNDEDTRDLRIDIDELYENKKKTALIKLKMYNKILQRIHQRIKVTSRQRNENTMCYFVMPEVMIGFPTYDIADCLVYIMSKLEENGFLLKYIHPNLLLISWNHWVPDYVRNEFRKKTGVEIDSYGNRVPTKKEKIINELSGLTSKTTMNQNKKDALSSTTSKKTKNNNNNKLLDLKTKLLYDNDIISKITDKL